MSYYTSWRARLRDRHATALSGYAGSWTYADLVDAVDRAATWLQQEGVGRGDLIALQMPRDPSFLVLHLAALRGGIGTLPLNPRYTDHEVSFILEDAGPALAVLMGAPTHVSDMTRVCTPSEAAAGIAQAVAAPPPMVDDDEALALLCYTSGTTGRPKGAPTLHRHLRAHVEALHEAWHWHPSDILVHALPLFHVHGLIVAQHVALWAGAHTVWMERFDPARVLATIEDSRATIFMGVPTFYRRFLEAGPSRDVSSVRLFTSGSAPLPAAVHRAFQDAFGHQILERYGMTEIGIVLSNPYEGVRKPGTVGLPLPGVRCRVVVPDTDDDVPKGEVGEVLISGPSVFDGYLGRPDATARALRDGWMHTGDLGRFDEDGYVALQGRRNDLILVGGFNVYPLEVESVLRMLPGVVDVAVVGIPHDDLGEVAVAAIVADDQLPTDAAIQEHLQAHLAGYKVPRQVRRVDALPRNAMGKVQKTRIRATW